LRKANITYDQQQQIVKADEETLQSMIAASVLKRDHNIEPGEEGDVSNYENYHKEFNKRIAVWHQNGIREID
jgi:hypothetical protein